MGSVGDSKASVFRGRADRGRGPVRSPRPPSFRRRTPGLFSGRTGAEKRAASTGSAERRRSSDESDRLPHTGGVLRAARARYFIADDRRGDGLAVGVGARRDGPGEGRPSIAAPVPTGAGIGRSRGTKRFVDKPKGFG